jgi:hypothetical protein
MFFESMHCLFLTIANKQHTQQQKTGDNHLHHGGNKRRKEKRKKSKEKGTYHHPRGRTNKPTTEQQRGSNGRGKAE